MDQIRNLVVAGAMLLAASAARGQAYSIVILQSAGYNVTVGKGIAGKQQVGYSNQPVGHPLAWNGSGNSVTDLNPAGYLGGYALATDGVHQVGWTVLASGDNHHAAYWNGSSSSYVDLHPANFDFSEAYGIGGGQSVGGAYGVSTNNQMHPILWTGPSASDAVDLNPDGYEGSSALATDGSHQVGVGNAINPSHTSEPHALVWSGSASSVVDLNPGAGYISYAYGIGGGQIVGEIQANNAGHAAAWSGPDHILTDLGYGVAYATNGTTQVGSYSTDAAAWFGTAASFVDLQKFLPSDFQTVQFPSSTAYGIDASGDIVGTANGPNGNVAVMWIPVVPEPDLALTVILSCVMLLTLRR